jgi:hypothetical protein
MNRQKIYAGIVDCVVPARQVASLIHRKRLSYRHARGKNLVVYHGFFIAASWHENPEFLEKKQVDDGNGLHLLRWCTPLRRAWLNYGTLLLSWPKCTVWSDALHYSDSKPYRQ